MVIRGVGSRASTSSSRRQLASKVAAAALQAEQMSERREELLATLVSPIDKLTDDARSRSSRGISSSQTEGVRAPASALRSLSLEPCKRTTRDIRRTWSRLLPAACSAAREACQGGAQPAACCRRRRRWWRKSHSALASPRDDLGDWEYPRRYLGCGRKSPYNGRRCGRASSLERRNAEAGR